MFPAHQNYLRSPVPFIFRRVLLFPWNKWHYSRSPEPLEGPHFTLCSACIFTAYFPQRMFSLSLTKCYFNYSRTSMARTSLGPYKIVRDMGSSSHWGLIMVPGQEVNSDNLRNFFSMFYTIIVCWVYSLESPRWGVSNEYTQHTIPW